QNGNQLNASLGLALLTTVGRGIGQVMFQDNALSGLLMLIGIGIGNWTLALWALGGNLISTLTAYWSGCNPTDIRHGLYGFNGTLVGIAAGIWLSLSPLSFLLMALAAALSTGIVVAFKRQQSLPAYTAPFVLATWILIGFCTLVLPQCLQSAPSTLPIAEKLNAGQAVLTGIGQVMFQGNAWSGLCFLAGILLQSRIGAGYALLGALLPLPLALGLGVDASTINLGLMGYNGVLCAIALGGRDLRSFTLACGA
ncbi:urea transporter, partial [gut metagenome]